MTNRLQSNTTSPLGDQGELLVADFLRKQGYTILARNFRCRFGEIDLIAQKGEVLAFVEVKTRRHCYFPTECVVTPRKQSKIVKTAKFFLMKRPLWDKVCRFDVATVLYKDTETYDINYIENAFYEGFFL